jgi:hypothetical protein
MKSTRHFYLFKGSWIDHYDEMIEMLNPARGEKLSFWEPKDRSKEFTLLIIYNKPLSDSFCYRRDIWKSDETIFYHFYVDRLENFVVHGYNEFAGRLN